MNIQELTKNTTGEIFPSITMSATRIATAQMISLLEPGNTQLIFSRGGDQPNLIVKKISLSPKNIKKLLKVADSLIFSLSAAERIPINSVEEYMRIV